MRMKKVIGFPLVLIMTVELTACGGETVENAGIIMM